MPSENDSTERETSGALPLVQSPPLWRRILPWGTALVLIGVVLSQIRLHAVFLSLKAVNAPAYFAFISALCGINLVCDTLATARAYQLTIAPVAYRTVLVVRAASYLPSVINFHVGQAYLTYMLARVYGTPLPRVVGGTLVVYATTFGSLLALTAAALPLSHGALPWLTRSIALMLAAGVVYLLVLAWRPRALVKHAALAPLFEAGPGGHLFLMLWRIPHITVQFGGVWLSYWFFGVTLPLVPSLAYLPILLLIAALPITPQGVGARELVAMQLLAPFAYSATSDATTAIVAAGAAWVAALTVVSATIGLVFTRSATSILRGSPKVRLPTGFANGTLS